MATIEGRAKIDATITLALSEEEAAALDAIVGYGADAFLEKFYELGKAYLHPHEAGLRSLFESVQSGKATVRHFLDRAQSARDVFNGRKLATAYPDKNAV